MADFFNTLDTGVLHNIHATVDPDADNDITEGYNESSIWVNETDDTAFICVDNSEGAAVWVEATVTSGGISDVVEDTTPQLGGNLDVNTFDLTNSDATPELDFFVAAVNDNVVLRAHNTAGSGSTSAAWLEALVDNTGRGNVGLSLSRGGTETWSMGIDTSGSGSLKWNATAQSLGSPKLTLTTAGRLGILTESPAALLEIEDGSQAGATVPIVKITQDDQTPLGLVIGNDTFSTTDTEGLTLQVLNSGLMRIKAAGTGGNLALATEAVGDCFRISSTGALTSFIPDNTATALTLTQSGDSYLTIVTTDSSEAITFGNATTNPAFNFLGSGVVTIAGSLDVPVAINAQTGTSYTGVLTDSYKLVTMSNASANTFTIPTNASVAYPVGTRIEVVQLGAGTTSIEGDTGVTLNGVSAGSGDINNQFQGVALTKIATDTWIASGDIGTVA